MSTEQKLPKNLESIIQNTEIKAREIGLDFFTTVFELVDYKKLHEVAAYGGLPKRYPHWRWGMEYDKLMKSYKYGLATIYEMVINNDPCFAYLLDSNHLSTQKTVISHVLGHSDFFKNNIWFSKTNRKMLDQAANHASIIKEMINETSYNEVEDFIDTCLSLENLLDPGQLFSFPDLQEDLKEEQTPLTKEKGRKDYLDSFLTNMDRKQPKEDEPTLIRDEQDIMGFLCKHAKLPPWKEKILQIIRSEAYYFLPQRQTKILNEGWATYWHSKMMTELHPLDITEIIDYCCQYAAIVESNGQQINPYKLGLELLKYVERSYETEPGAGKKKLFEVRKIHNDLSFLDNFLDEEFCHETKMFLYDYDPNQKIHVPNEKDFKQVKGEIIHSLTNCGWPIIKIADDNFNQRGELLLRHSFDGQALKQDKTLETLKKIHSLWSKPVHLETKIDTIQKRFSFDGKDTSIRKL